MCVFRYVKKKRKDKSPRHVQFGGAATGTAASTVAHRHHTTTPATPTTAGTHAAAPAGADDTPARRLARRRNTPRFQGAAGRFFPDGPAAAAKRAAAAATAGALEAAVAGDAACVGASGGDQPPVAGAPAGVDPDSLVSQFSPALLVATHNEDVTVAELRRARRARQAQAAVEGVTAALELRTMADRAQHDPLALFRKVAPDVADAQLAALKAEQRSGEPLQQQQQQQQHDQASSPGAGPHAKQSTSPPRTATAAQRGKRVSFGAGTKLSPVGSAGDAGSPGNDSGWTGRRESQTVRKAAWVLRLCMWSRCVWATSSLREWFPSRAGRHSTAHRSRRAAPGQSHGARVPARRQASCGRATGGVRDRRWARPARRFAACSVRAQSRGCCCCCC